MSGQNPREIAARVLGRRGEDAFTEDLFESAQASAELEPADRSLCQELVYGVVRWQATLDWLISRKTRNRLQKRPLLNLLRLGLYQLFWLDRIPHHAAVHETVELARLSGFGAQAGFINAVLRAYTREAESTRQLLNELTVTKPHLGYSHPEWLAVRWQARWGQPDASRLMAWNNIPPKIYARVNTLKTDPGKLLDQWREENVDYDFVSRNWLPENIVFELKSYPSLARLPSFQQGLFYVQDPSTLLAVSELDPRPGESVLDLCAAPGGKLTYIAQLMRNKGKLLAFDVVPDRLRLIRQNCARLGVTCVETCCPDKTPVSIPQGGPELRGSSLTLRCSPLFFDRILVDVPCSNTGVMRRRVDLRWRMRPEEIERLHTTQLALLSQASGMLKRGGVLVYSTCSLEPEENEAVTQEFLKDNPKFALERCRRLTPFRDDADGAYIARCRSSTELAGSWK